MDDQRTDRKGSVGVSNRGEVLARIFVVVLCFGLAAALIAANIFHQPRSHDYGGLGLMIAPFVMVPFWSFRGVLALAGYIRTAFWLAILPGILVFVITMLP